MSGARREAAKTGPRVETPLRTDPAELDDTADGVVDPGALVRVDRAQRLDDLERVHDGRGGHPGDAAREEARARRERGAGDEPEPPLAHQELRGGGAIGAPLGERWEGKEGRVWGASGRDGARRTFFMFS